MTLHDCGMNDNAAAWRMAGPGGMDCFVFYWNSDTKDVPTGGKTGECYIRDKVVPLGSLSPPDEMVTKHQHLLA
jgi:hypothetical protein